jgi:hypothetical protein
MGLCAAVVALEAGGAISIHHSLCQVQEPECVELLPLQLQ